MEPITELWDNTLSLVEERLDSRDFNAWIENRLTLARFDRTAGVLFIGVDTDFRKAQLELKYTEVVENAASEAFGEPVKIRFLLPDEIKKVTTTLPPPDSNEIIFDPRHTFDNFIVGDNSRFAAGMAQKVAESPGKAYSPLFIYSTTGLGKTHLMHAIGIYILEHFPKLRVLYVSSETFTDDFVNASINKKMPLFKEKYRGVDVLLIDDIQFINAKDKTAEEVFHTFEALYTSGKQMVFASDMPPKDFLGVDERLRRRLGQGMLVDIKPPSYEIKVAILKNEAALKQVPEDEGLSDVISFIAEHIKTNVSELLAAFTRVVAFAKLMDKPFSKALAKEVLKDVMRISGNEPTSKDIKKVVAKYFDITVADIDSKNRAQALSNPRQIAVYLCYTLGKLSFPKIAEDFKKDTSTVQHAHKKIKEEIKINDHLNNIVNEITEKIKNEY